MDLVNAILLSIVEGVTEFLPVSSTGHLILASRLIPVPQTEFVKSFEIIIQLGAILAVVVLYWRSLLINFEIGKRVFVAFVPTAIVGLALYKVIKTFLLGNTSVTLWSLLIGGIILIVLELLYKEKEHHLAQVEKLPLKKAFLIGLAQSLSVIPGVSRAAATIMGGLFLGLKRESAVQFSFLLAVPTMLAATLLDIVKMDFAFTADETTALVVGLVGSFVVALITVKFFLKYIQNHTFIGFGIYRIVVALLFWLFVH